MKDGEYGAFKATLKECVSFWKKRLGLEDYIITVNYMRGLCPENPDRGAYTNVFWAYRDAEITFYLEQLLGSYKTVNSIVCHELVHILLAPISSNLEPGFEQQHEFVCENISREFLKAYGFSVTKEGEVEKGE